MMLGCTAVHPNKKIFPSFVIFPAIVCLPTLLGLSSPRLGEVSWVTMAKLGNIPSPSSTAKDLLALLHERILLFDGAMGTSIQDRQPSAVDFGGPQYDGCNEHLVLTRPQLI